MSTPETDRNANPFADGRSSSSGLGGASETFLYRVSANQFPLFASNTLTDPLSNLAVTQTQDLWVRGDNHFDPIQKSVVPRVDLLVYSTKFDRNGFGLPSPENNKISFLGKTWIITGSTKPAESSSGEVVAGGSLTLQEYCAADVKSPQEIQLTNGSTLNGWSVILGWKGGLRTIIISSDAVGTSANEKTFVLPLGLTLNYTGLSTDSNPSIQAPLEFQLMMASRRISSSNGPLIEGVPADCVVQAPYLLITSGRSGSVFTSNGISGQLADNEVIFPLFNGVTCNNGQLFKFEGGSVSIMALSPGSTAYGIGSATVNYDKIGNGTTTSVTSGGTISVSGPLSFADVILQSAGAQCSGNTCSDPTGAKNSVADFYVVIAETAGSDMSLNYVDYSIIGIDGTGTSTASDATFSFNSTATNNSLTLTSQGQLLYGHATVNADYSVSGSGPVNSSMEIVSSGYQTERGS
ncbi:hypothetical protein HZC07_03305, partial [Candidatus Micrarchaeota archaeon]|nr:hypothetical protein [Candidatus Micrarchaeota archaeon]